MPSACGSGLPILPAGPHVFSHPALLWMLLDASGFFLPQIPPTQTCSCLWPERSSQASGSFWSFCSSLITASESQVSTTSQCLPHFIILHSVSPFLSPEVLWAICASLLP